jgi:hypothetical protein
VFCLKFNTIIKLLCYDTGGLIYYNLPNVSQIYAIWVSSFYYILTVGSFSKTATHVLSIE